MTTTPHKRTALYWGGMYVSGYIGIALWERCSIEWMGVWPNMWLSLPVAWAALLITRTFWTGWKTQEKCYQ